ncbi:MAG: DUF2723 domain-containing protein [Bacteroidetes bacterium]|nr:DUF2723 domain-containing protein [Bacteroidota bacterium]
MKNFINRFPAQIASIISFIVYLFTIAPSVIQIDSGELATAQATLGICHPTGYPLFTILGYLWLQLPLPFTSIFMSNLLSAIWCSASIYFFVATLIILFDFEEAVPELKLNKKVKANLPALKRLEKYEKSLLAILGGLFLSLTQTFWFQSTSVEVYSLHVLILAILIFILAKIHSADSRNSHKKYWLYLAAILALGFSNHLTTVLILPGIAFLFFYKNRFRKESFFLLIEMLLIFFPTLILIYSYLPIRASLNPALNWGNPESLSSFWRHFSGAQYSTWIFSSFDAAKEQLTYFISNLPNEFSIPGLLLILIGLIFFLKTNRIFSSFIIICSIITVGYSINYDINDIDSYFLLAYISAGFFAAFGFYYLYIKLFDKFNKIVISTLLFLIVFFVGWNNFANVSQRDNYIFEDYTKAILESVEDESIIFSYQWDYFLAASYYYQYVESVKKNVSVIDKELLRRSWYYNQMNTNYPDIILNRQDNISKFLGALHPFEHGEKFDSQALEKYYRAIMTGLVSDNIESHNFYLGVELVTNELRSGEFSLPEGYIVVPHNLLFKVVKGAEYAPAPDPDFIFRNSDVVNKYTDFIKNTIFSMLTYRALYELSFNKADRVRLYVNKIKEMFPGKLLHKDLQMFSG